MNTQATKEISDWLEKLGMSEYAQRFAENGIDVAVLPHLTDQDLKDIGVLARASADNAARPLGSLPALSRHHLQPAATEPKHQDTAERRQVTVMFSDLVGSTALSARMDPEDLREVISAYQKCVAETVQRFGGFVAKYMGDGVLVYFGYPQAHEDDAERAVRAGLELIAAVGRLKSSAPLQTRVGIATGLVVVGDLIGSGAAQEQRHRRRDTKPCGAPAGDCRAEHGRHCREHTKTARQFVRAGGPRGQGPQGYRRAGAGVGGAAAKFGGEPLRGVARDRPHRSRRAGGRTRIAAAALVEGKDRRRSGGAPVRRGRHRQVAAHRCAAGTPR